jgi:flagellar motor switch protein FliN/FliY
MMAEDQPPADKSGLGDPFGSGDASSPIDQAAIDELLKHASFEDVSSAMGDASARASVPRAARAAKAPAEAPAATGTAVAVPELDEVKLPNFNQVIRDAQVSSIDLLRDVDLSVKIELGRARMLVEDVLRLGEGSVVELDKLAGDPVDVFVNERLVARGEVLVLNDNFCVRINEIVAGSKEEGL